MTLNDLGYDPAWDHFRKNQGLEHFEIGRVISEHKERYIVKTADKEYDAEIIGQMRFSASQRADFPAVGDWVAISEYDEDKALIHALYPRKTILERQMVGKHGEKQIIATNIDFAFIVQAVDRDFNINRLQRFLTICNATKVAPIIILNKIDLIDPTELEERISQIKERVQQVPIIAISNTNQIGIAELKAQMQSGKTYSLLGSSGVGKSSLLNNLSGKQIMETNSISASTQKGRHITSHRELTLLDNGAILIDNPGMREVGITNLEGGLEKTFEQIHELANSCKFNDCTHTTEIGCAVLEALENGELDENSYENYLKMEREKDHFESTIAERRKRDKAFGKMVKEIMKEKKSKKY